MKKEQTEVKSDFKLAKEVIGKLEVHGEETITCAKVGNFRKYLRDLSKYTEKRFITRFSDGKTTIIRLK